LKERGWVEDQPQQRHPSNVPRLLTFHLAAADSAPRNTAALLKLGPYQKFYRKQTREDADWEWDG